MSIEHKRRKDNPLSSYRQKDNYQERNARVTRQFLGIYFPYELPGNSDLVIQSYKADVVTSAPRALALVG